MVRPSFSAPRPRLMARRPAMVGRSEKLEVFWALVWRRTRRCPQQPRAGGEYSACCSKYLWRFFLQHMMRGVWIEFLKRSSCVCSAGIQEDDDCFIVVLCSPLYYVEYYHTVWRTYRNSALLWMPAVECGVCRIVFSLSVVLTRQTSWADWPGAVDMYDLRPQDGEVWQ